MHKQLSPTMAAELDRICGQMRVARRLDEHIARELRGHLEDKLLAYLSGEEKLTEDDALLLVENHFGNPATVQAMLREVHVEENAEGWGRRLAVIVMVTCVFDCVSILAGVLGARLDIALRQVDWLEYSAAMFFSACGTIALWRIALRWRNRERRNQQTWYAKRSTLCLWGGALACLLAEAATLAIASSAPRAGPGVGTPVSKLGLLQWTCILVYSVGQLLNLSRGLIWMWWCNNGSKQRWPLWAAAMAWAALMLLPLVVLIVTTSSMHLSVANVCIAVTEYVVASVVLCAFYVIAYAILQAIGRLRSKSLLPVAA